MNSAGGTIEKIYKFADGTGHFIIINGISGCFWLRGNTDVVVSDKVAVQFEGEYNEKDSDSRKITKLIKLT
jgi:hypothetical protein